MAGSPTASAPATAIAPVAFASRIQALSAPGASAVPARRSLLPQALDAYLAFTYIPAPWTIFEQVRKVPAGHVVVFDLRAPEAAETIRYWRLPDRSGGEGTPARMLEMLRTETWLTCRVDRLPDDYSFSKQGWRRETFDLDATIFDGAEYVKDGLLPVTE